MNTNYREVVQKVNSHLAAHPNASLLIVAEKLQTTSQAIEEALQNIEGIGFDEFRAGIRLEQAFEQLGEMSPAANGPYERMRARRRIAIPKATLRYRMIGFWRRKSDFSGHCPLVDLSPDGLAFLADQARKPDRGILLVLNLPGETETLQLRGRIVYSVATGIVGYRYRIGVQFLPFAERRGCNSLKALDVITRLERICPP